MYSAITYFLGFKPQEHEYKLMGLSPYVNPEYVKPYLDILKGYIKI
jgi:carbamoyltransferase